ncbi:hypothetical protein BC629DRAFT_1526401 [Irpex lacteus]|nr:hypothetical protein BC629DRAFT_1526401 [Irpex lacteus]
MSNFDNYKRSMLHVPHTSHRRRVGDCFVRSFEACIELFKHRIVTQPRQRVGRP